MAHHVFSEFRETIEAIQQGKLKELAIPKLVAVGDTVEFVSPPTLYPPHEALDFPEENPINAFVVVSKVERGPDHRFPWLIHWKMTFEVRIQSQLEK